MKREQLINDFRAVSASHHDEQALRLAFIAALVEYGWNKAFDGVECPDEAIRTREAADLDWWVRHAREGLETWSPV